MSIRHLLKRAGLVLTYLQSRHKSLLHSETTQERVRIEGPPILLKADAAQAIAVILHELSTNAAKYGALSVDSGRVNLNWSHEKDARLHLHWTETGGPKVQEPTRKGFINLVLLAGLLARPPSCVLIQIGPYDRHGQRTFCNTDEINQLPHQWIAFVSFGDPLEPLPELAVAEKQVRGSDGCRIS